RRPDAGHGLRREVRAVHRQARPDRARRRRSRGGRQARRLRGDEEGQARAARRDAGPHRRRPHRDPERPARGRGDPDGTAGRHDEAGRARERRQPMRTWRIVALLLVTAAPLPFLAAAPDGDKEPAKPKRSLAETGPKPPPAVPPVPAVLEETILKGV